MPFKDLDLNEKDLIGQLDWYKHEYYAECDRAEQLEKALDKACEKLSKVIDIEGCNGFCGNYTVSERNGCKCDTKGFWKEWCMKDE